MIKYKISSKNNLLKKRKIQDPLIVNEGIFCKGNEAIIP